MTERQGERERRQSGFKRKRKLEGGNNDISFTAINDSEAHQSLATKIER